MATDDQQVLVTGTASAPTHFTIPGNGQIRPKSVFAHYDGTGAAGAFVPALKIKSDGGELVAICPTTQTVAAGGSAAVSWFQGLGGAGGGGVQALVGARIEAHNPQAVSTATNTDVVYDSVAFDTDGMVNLGANSRILTVNTSGLYLVVCETTWDANNAGRRLNGITVNGYTSGGAPFLATDSRNAVFTPVASPGHTPNTSIGVFSAVAGDFFASGCLQGSGGNLNCNGLQAGSNQDNFLSALLIGEV